jgi:F subunit of K+-transporting ATPase (Potass_KdpF)
MVLGLLDPRELAGLVLGGLLILYLLFALLFPEKL